MNNTIIRYLNMLFMIILLSSSIYGTTGNIVTVNINNNAIIHIFILILILFSLKFAINSTGIYKIMFSISGALIICYGILWQVTIVGDRTLDYRFLQIAQVFSGVIGVIGLMLIFAGILYYIEFKKQKGME